MLKILTGLETLIEELVEGSKACSFECSSMSLGALMKAMKGMKLLGPRPAPSLEGFSLSALKKALGKIATPDYQVIQPRRIEVDEYDNRVIIKHSSHITTCYLPSRIRPIVDEQYYGINGLKLDDFMDGGNQA